MYACFFRDGHGERKAILPMRKKIFDYFRLKRMRAELDAGETRLRSQQKLMAEDEASLNERRTELRRLSSKVSD